MKDGLFILNLLPLEALLAAGGVEALAILPGGVEQAARHLGHDVAIPNLERGRLDGKWTVIALDQVVANASRAVADHTLSMLAQESQAWADAVGGVVHGRQAGPVIGPAVHVLLMAAAQELNPAQLALVV